MKIDRALWFVHVMQIFAILGSGGMVGYALTLAPLDPTHLMRLWPSAVTFLASTAAVVTTGFMLRRPAGAQ